MSEEDGKLLCEEKAGLISRYVLSQSMLMPGVLKVAWEKLSGVEGVYRMVPPKH